MSYSSNPSAPPSPTGHPGPPNLTSDGLDQNSYFLNHAQAAALQQDFEQFTMVSKTPVFRCSTCFRYARAPLCIYLGNDPATRSGTPSSRSSSTMIFVPAFENGKVSTQLYSSRHGPSRTPRSFEHLRVGFESGLFDRSGFYDR